jgi:hypothetical protein
MSKLAIIVGCGRSGTKMVAWWLSRSDKITVTIEPAPLFFDVQKAIYDDDNAWHSVVAAYRRVQEECPTPWHVNKCHPSLWLAPKLAEAFPGVRFICVDRGPHATVASMLAHRPTYARLAKYAEYGVPDPQMGIRSQADRAWFGRATMTERVTHKWCAHHEEVHRLAGSMPEACLLIHFERFVERPVEAAAEASEFVGFPLPKPAVDVRRLTAWRDTLVHWEEVDRVLHLRGYGDFALTPDPFFYV